MKKNITPVGKASLENPIKILTATTSMLFYTYKYNITYCTQ